MLVLSLDDTAVVLVLDIAEVVAMIAEWELMDAVEAEEIRFRLHLGRLEKKPNPKYRYPPPPPIAVAIPSYRLNFSIFNDMRVAWSRRKRRNRSLQPSALYYPLLSGSPPTADPSSPGTSTVSSRSHSGTYHGLQTTTIQPTPLRPFPSFTHTIVSLYCRCSRCRVGSRC